MRKSIFQWALRKTLGGLVRLSGSMGIDLGTANTLVYVHGRGIVLNEPSMVAVDDYTGRVLAVGNDAKRMVGRTPARISAIRPLRNGVIADFDVTEAMIRHFIHKVNNRQLFVHPSVVIGVPSGVTEVERRAVEDAARQAGAWQTRIMDEPMAAAIGAGMPVSEPVGNMIVDIGGGTSEIAVISLGGICVQRSLRSAGEAMDEAIATYLRQEVNLYVGETTAEQIKINIGSAFPLPQEMTMQVRGKDVITGLPRKVVVSSTEIREACAEPIAALLEMVKESLDVTPPELAADIMNRGIVLAGGGALLRGLDQLISAETDIPVYVAENPMECVVLGTARYLEQLGEFPFE